ncbi:hypothetical protein SmJEL517_g05565 [Synchytrium microbalum]|uniref:Uncharacterized protein n=1 Tax=Synchytrium microbalum TaxID=1806994 RepID=A0A507BV08_9FUNG|nr:uncharacterized protein SmJEL517_g05565 [Synchytrium microbalum]TPX31021.1 hypothetical protein SmJEL517_g05565 [Synchytrium microbalum]
MAMTTTAATDEMATISNPSTVASAQANSAKLWSTFEDLRLCAAVSQNDDRWMLIASAFPGRSAADCMSRYNELVADNLAPPILKRRNNTADPRRPKKPKIAPPTPAATGNSASSSSGRALHIKSSLTPLSDSAVLNKKTSPPPTPNMSEIKEMKKKPHKVTKPASDGIVQSSTKKRTAPRIPNIPPRPNESLPASDVYHHAAPSSNTHMDIYDNTIERLNQPQHSQDLNLYFSDIFDESVHQQHPPLELSSDGHALALASAFAMEDIEDEEDDADDSASTVDSILATDGHNPTSPSDEMDFLFGEYLENLPSSERDNILPPMPAHPHWVHDASFGFTCEQAETLKDQMLANFQILVQAFTFSSELYGAADSTSGFFSSQLNKLRDLQRHAKTQKLERSVFRHPALSIIPSIIKSEPHPNDKKRHECITNAFENPTHRKDYDRMNERIHGDSFDEWMTSIRNNGDMVWKARTCVSPWPALLDRIVSSTPEFFHDDILPIVIPVRRHRNPFLEHEDELLRMGSERCGGDLREVRARFLPARTVVQMKTRISNLSSRGGADNPIRRFHLLPFKPLTELERHILRETCRKLGPRFGHTALIARPTMLLDATLDLMELHGEYQSSSKRPLPPARNSQYKSYKAIADQRIHQQHALSLPSPTSMPSFSAPTPSANNFVPPPRVKPINVKQSKNQGKAHNQKKQSKQDNVNKKPTAIPQTTSSSRPPLPRAHPRPIAPRLDSHSEVPQSKASPGATQNQPSATTPSHEGIQFPDDGDMNVKSPALGSEAYFAESETENLAAGWSSEQDDGNFGHGEDFLELIFSSPQKQIPNTKKGQGKGGRKRTKDGNRDIYPVPHVGGPRHRSLSRGRGNSVLSDHGLPTPISLPFVSETEKERAKSLPTVEHHATTPFVMNPFVMSSLASMPHMAQMQLQSMQHMPMPSLDINSQPGFSVPPTAYMPAAPYGAPYMFQPVWPTPQMSMEQLAAFGLQCLMTQAHGQPSMYNYPPGYNMMPVPVPQYVSKPRQDEQNSPADSADG